MEEEGEEGRYGCDNSEDLSVGKVETTAISKQTSEILDKQDYEAAFASVSCLAAEHGRDAAGGREEKGGGEDGGEEEGGGGVGGGGGEG